MDFTNLGNMDFSNIPNYQMPAPQVVNNYTDLDPNRALSVYGQSQQDAPTKSIREALATPAPIYTPPPKMEEMFEDYDYGNPNLRDRGMFGPRR